MDAPKHSFAVYWNHCIVIRPCQHCGIRYSEEHRLEKPCLPPIVKARAA